MSLQLINPSTKQAINTGRLINLIDGINGITAGGVGSVNIPTDRRLHASVFQFTAVNFTGGTAVTTTAISSSGTGLTVTYTSTNGVPSALTIAAGGTGYAANDTFYINDATGGGAGLSVFKVSTVSSGAVTAAVNVSLAATPVNPASVCSLLKQNVSTSPMRDIAPLYSLMIAQANNYNSGLGELPLFYSEPWSNFFHGGDANSWDLRGQSSLQYQFFFNAGWQQLGIGGIMEFDNQANVLTDASGKVLGPNLEPITQHLLTANLVAGLNPITNIPIDARIKRIWLIGSSAGNLTQLEVLADGNKVLEGSVTQINQRLADYNFQFGRANYINQTQTSAKTLGLNPINYFDTACIFDIDQRYTKGLACASSLSLRVTSAVTQSLTIIYERLPGLYLP